MSRAAFDLWIGPLSARESTVVSFRGCEAVNDLYRFDIVFQTDVDVLSFEPTLLGAPVTLVMHVQEDDAPRAVSGVVSRLGGDGALDQGKRGFRLRLVPRLWLLSRRKTTRIFQDLSLMEIISSVLDQHAVPRIWNLSKTYSRRAYSVQYRETDYDFIARLCAEAGIFYYFLGPQAPLADLDTPAEGLVERVVFCDGAQHYPAIAGGAFDPAAGSAVGTVLPVPSLLFRPGDAALTGAESVHEFIYRRTLRAQSVALRDYDYQRPLLDLAASIELDEHATVLARKGTELLAAAPAAVPGNLEVYEHHGDYGENDVSNDQADIQLEQHRARAMLARGKSSCRRLAAGHRFRLEGSPQSGVDGEYAVVRLRHEGSEAVMGGGRGGAAGERRYQNRFECVPASIAYRPARPARDLSQVLESAVVTGPAGQEIFTDKLGRIKVQFHWDREGAENEHSSCWMRVMQPWAGTSWGFQFIPRIGMEVLVSFLGGDEDRPVVMGSVYNATHPPAFPLPLSQTQSGIRTQTVGGQGANELSFEDVAGGELVLLKAQRDLQEQALRDHGVRVGADQTVQVAGSQSVQVGGERHDSVGGVETRSVGGAQFLAIEGEQQIRVGGRKTEIITDSLTTRSHGVSHHNAGHHSETVEGYATTTVGGDERPTGLSVTVYGNESHDVTESLTLRSEKRILLQCGNSSITLMPSAIRIDAKVIVLKAEEKLVLLGDGPGIELAKEVDILADTIKLFSRGGSLELDSEAAHVDGPLVKLNCGAGDEPEIEDDAAKPKTKTFRWRFLDTERRPYKDKTYRLITQGFKCKGTTDSDGVIEREIPEEAFSAQLTLWTEDFPEGERLSYHIQLGDLAPASSVYGAQTRLKNLGYYLGPESDEMSPELASALLRFQQDNGLSITGELDGETTDKIEEVHP